MTTRPRSWGTPLVGLVAGTGAAVILAQRSGSPLVGLIVFAIIGGYVLALVLFRARSDTASVLSGEVVDERWELIHQRALSLTAQVMAAALVGAFLFTELSGGDATPYMWSASLVGATYLGAMFWYRSRM
jgi:uncharacterized membrane protein